jgi:RNA polymerase sigma factor (TIGR02999 family)
MLRQRHVTPMSDVTRILTDIEHGDPRAAGLLLPLVYDELRKLASQRMANEHGNHTLQPTALVHEAYVRLLEGGEPAQWNTRGHFFAAAAEAMRRILVERARERASLKRGGGRRRLELEDLALAGDAEVESSDDVLALNAALVEFERHDPQAASLVKLRYFAGLTHQQAADSLGISRRAADRLWALSKAWLYRQMNKP